MLIALGLLIWNSKSNCCTSKANNQTIINNQNNKVMKSNDNFNELIKGTTPVLVDFYADWCSPCRVQAPILDELKKDLGDKVKIIKVNVDNNGEIASKYGIFSIPTLIIFKEGEVKWKASGVRRAEELKQILENL